jgi:hypothetical protein
MVRGHIASSHSFAVKKDAHNGDREKNQDQTDMFNTVRLME